MAKTSADPKLAEWSRGVQMQHNADAETTVAQWRMGEKGFVAPNDPARHAMQRIIDMAPRHGGLYS